MALMIKNARVFAPQSRGLCDILTIHDKIVAIDKKLDDCGLRNLDYLDAAGRMVIPGLVDGHAHLIGGGGEGGFATRTPAVELSTLTTAGITTVVGLLGTDCVTRQPGDLYARTMGLRAEGLSAFMFTGGYRVPSPTITGSIQQDIVYVEPVIGLKTAISDHRSSHPSLDELIRLASDARVAGMLSGKCGRVVVHLGNAPQGLRPLHDLADASAIPPSQFIPTHVNRSEGLMAESLAWLQRGGYIDLSAGIDPARGAKQGVNAAGAIASVIESDLATDLERICISSDGNGSIPAFDRTGNLDRLTRAGFDCLLDILRQMVQQENLPLDRALIPLTRAPANCLGLSARKGELAAGKDADLLVLNDDFSLGYTVALGRILVADGKVARKGTFEDS